MEVNKFEVLGEKSWVLLLVPILLFLFLYLLGRPIFEYDSDGEALNFRNYHIGHLFTSKNAKDEFPKYKLLRYSVVNALFFKTLYIYISSKKSDFVILKYDISFLKNKQIRDLKTSLNKVVKANNEIRKDNNTVID